jgi:anti-sigma factor RsiW
MRWAESLCAQAYFDGELDARSAANVERQSETCAECRALIDGLEQIRSALRNDLTYASAPLVLRAQIMRSLDRERPRLKRETLARWWPGPFLRAAFGGTGGTVIATGIAFFLLTPSLSNWLLDDPVSAHVRSLCQII